MVMSRRPDNPGQVKTRQNFVQTLSLFHDHSQRKELGLVRIHDPRISNITHDCATLQSYFVVAILVKWTLNP